MFRHGLNTIISKHQRKYLMSARIILAGMELPTSTGGIFILTRSIQVSELHYTAKNKRTEQKNLEQMVTNQRKALHHFKYIFPSFSIVIKLTDAISKIACRSRRFNMEV